MTLSDEPPLGEWKTSVTVSGERTSRKFTVKEYGKSLHRRIKSNQTNCFIVRLKVDQRAGQLCLPQLGITKTEKVR